MNIHLGTEILVVNYINLCELGVLKTSYTMLFEHLLP